MVRGLEAHFIAENGIAQHA